jgi:hypothetical protein
MMETMGTQAMMLALTSYNPHQESTYSSGIQTWLATHCRACLSKVAGRDGRGNQRAFLSSSEVPHQQYHAPTALDPCEVQKGNRVAGTQSCLDIEVAPSPGQ